MAPSPSPPLHSLEPAASPLSPDDEAATQLLGDAPDGEDDLDAELQLAALRRRLAGAEVEPVRFRHWEVERRLGRGGMGAVYLARDPELERSVALKILAAPPGSDRSLLNHRLRREAQALARIVHPNVVQVYGVDREAGRTVIEMEYVDGITLRQWQQTPRSWRDVVAVYLRVGEGLVAIHEAGLVHRDVKPDNLLMTREGAVKVVDLGLVVGPRTPVAAPIEAPRSSLLGLPLTRGSSIVGTPGYMAPEQFGKDEPTAACDQFSFAASLYEAIIGVLPFRADEPAGYAEAMRRGVLHVPEGAPRLPRWLTRALRRALRFAPGERHPSMRELVDVMRRGLGRRRRWLLGSGGLLLVVGLPAIVWVWREPPPDPCAPLATEVDATRARDDATRDTVAAHLTRLGQSHVEVAGRAFDEAFSRHARRWADARVELCDARERAQADTTRLLELHREEACLGYVRARLDGALGVVSEADGSALASRLTDALREVEHLPACDDPAMLARWPTNTPPELDQALARASRLELEGDYPAAEAEARSAAEASRAHPFLHAHALYRLGHVLGRQERRKATLATITLARDAALEVGDESLFCEAVAYQAKVLAALELDPAASRRELGLAGACEALLGARSSFVRAELLEARGLLALAADDPEQAVAWHEQALAIRIQTLGPTHYEVGKSLHNRANAEAVRGDLEQAQAGLHRALALHEQVIGSRHPVIARVLFDLADVQIELGALDDAKASLERAAAVVEGVYGPQAPALAGIHLSLARAEVLRPHPELAFARARLERARELQHDDPELDPHHPDRATAWQLEGALVILETRPDIDFARALAAFSQATEILRHHDPRSPDVLASVTKELEMLAGLRDHAWLAARVAAEGSPLVDYVEQLEPSERGRLAWWIGDASFGAGRHEQAASYLEIAHDAHHALGDQAATDELTAALQRARHPHDPGATP